MEHLHRLYQWIFQFFQKATQDRITVYGAQAAFFVMISAIPFVMLIVALLQFIMPLTRSQLSLLAMEVIPLSLHSHTIRIIDELYSQSSVSLISVTALSALWAASKSLYALTRGLMEIYHAECTRRFVPLRIVSLFHTLLFLVILIFSLGVLVFGSQVQAFFEQYFPLIAKISACIISFRTLLSMTLLSFVFASMYKILPQTKSGFRHQLPGAVFSALGWMIFSLAYALYIDHFSRISYLYGSLTAVVFLMLWLYSCMNLFLLGAEINVWLLSQDPWESRP